MTTRPLAFDERTVLENMIHDGPLQDLVVLGFAASRAAQMLDIGDIPAARRLISDIGAGVTRTIAHLREVTVATAGSASVVR